uniref:Uncharacterized protein n=1 Tax=Rhizophora mucronata TaxID=61149 RepID=A0A2P2NB65_RHIMU
MTGVVILKRK